MGGHDERRPWYGRLRELRKRLRAEIVLVSILGLTAGALLGFAQIADEVVEGEARAIDARILGSLRSPADPADPIGPWWVEALFRDATALGGVAVLALVSLIALGYLLIDGKHAAALLAALAIGGGTAVSYLLKSLFARPRPDLVAHLVEVRTSSFPSGHAMLSAVTYLTLGALLARIQPRRRLKVYLLLVALLLTLLVGTSRVYLGVHWPTDVLAGWCVGSAWAMSCWLAALWLQRRGRLEGKADQGAG